MTADSKIKLVIIVTAIVTAAFGYSIVLNPF